MYNMSYCRFDNTTRDLRDCSEHILDDLESETEFKARKELVEICKNIIDEWESMEMDKEEYKEFDENEE